MWNNLLLLRLKKALFFGLGALLYIAPMAAFSHDLVMAEFHLVETAANQYQLSRISAKRADQVIAAPGLPPSCSYQTEKNRLAEDVFWFQCDKPLTSSDQFVFSQIASALVMQVTWHNGQQARALFLAQQQSLRVALGELSAPRPALGVLLQRYGGLGLQHIAAGIDHLLFIAGLMFIINGPWRLVQAITAFTLAHSLTLALAFLQWLQLAPAPVEACIAASIVCLALDALRPKHRPPSYSQRWPWAVAGGFGLIHGLGFAGALQDVGVPQPEVVPALLFFNLGVELGQLLFMAGLGLGAAAVLRLAQHTGRQRWLPQGRALLAYAMGGVALYWALERSAPLLINAG